MNEEIDIQRPYYDKIGLGYFERESSKKNEVTKESNIVIHQPEHGKEHMNKVDSNQSEDVPNKLE